jgi:hypothetical protein
LNGLIDERVKTALMIWRDFKVRARGLGMDQFSYLVGLRQEVIGQIGGIENARPSLWWDDTMSNSSTRRALSEMLERNIALVAHYGILLVTRHCDCPNKRHPEYPTNNRYGLSIPYRSDQFIWEEDQLYQGKRFCTCPCSAQNSPSDHNVIDDIVFRRDSDLVFCRQVTSVLWDISRAVAKSENKKPRSGIREHLLRALLTINDAIMPQGVDDYINRRMNENSPA